MEYAISSAGLTKRFGSRAAVDGIDLMIKAGRITGFLGPNGAGKTTTISLLLGLLKADSGDCQVLGRSPGDLGVLRQIGALVESPSLYDHLTGTENLEITRLMRNLPKSDIGRVLNLVGLTQDARRPVRIYSLGMKQRLGMALALMGEPSLLILDEPMNGLDPAGILEMREMIRELPKKTGATVFLSSHILAEVEQAASDLTVIHRGRLRYQGPVDGLAAGDDSDILVKVDNPGKALGLLTQSGVSARIESEAILAQVAYNDIPKLNSALAADGLLVYEITPRRKNLEARFLSLLEGE
ncbi:MAG: ATP-binding cassette domain-containing protein [Holophagales bacterium]|nr:ATP-binding cassette domain-containing protein [Holophagales bacterium]